MYKLRVHSVNPRTYGHSAINYVQTRTEARSDFPFLHPPIIGAAFKQSSNLSVAKCLDISGDKSQVIVKMSFLN